MENRSTIKDLAKLLYAEYHRRVDNDSIKLKYPTAEKPVPVSNSKYTYMRYLVAFFGAEYEDSWGEEMQDVYDEVVLISTVAAVVTASIALLLMNFSKSGKTVDESRAWLKRIIITWVILNSLGFIISYIEPFLSGGKWSG